MANRPYRFHLPMVAKSNVQAPLPEPEPIPWRKRGVAGFTWGVVPDQHQGAGLGVTWGHSWNLQRGTYRGMKQYPMIWGLTRPEHPHYGLAYAIQNLPADYDDWLIVLNEPADEGQANLTPAEGVYLWMQVCAHWPRARLVGPQMLMAMQNTGFYARAQGWFQQFWAALPAEGRNRVEAHSYHNYLNLPDDHITHSIHWMNWCDAVAGARPYWVTEWGVHGGWGENGLDGGRSAVERIGRFYDEEDERVEKHAYFIPHVPPSDQWAPYRLFDDAGNLTGQGRGWLGL